MRGLNVAGTMFVGVVILFAAVIHNYRIRRRLTQ
jgi:hypothetical protein